MHWATSRANISREHKRNALLHRRLWGMDRSSELRRAGIVAIVAAAAAVYADLMLQYTPNAAHLGSRDYLYLLDVPARRLLIGHFAGVVAVLLEIAGFWQIAQGLL